MGNRVTRAATHLPEDAVYAQMQREPRPWRRKLWEIIYQALTAPRKAEDIADHPNIWGTLPACQEKMRWLRAS